MRVCARIAIGRCACPVQRAILGELIADNQTGLRARSFAPRAKYDYMSGNTGGRDVQENRQAASARIVGPGR
jgi:hypothetical protein